MKNILDISYYNQLSKKDYDDIAKNYEGVILRVGYTGWGKPAKNKVIDTAFKKHYEELSKRGIKLGGYWYGTDESPSEAENAAKKMFEFVGSRKMELGLFYDTEDNYYQRAMGKDLLTDTVLAFTNYLKSKVNVAVGVYASSSWFKNQLHFDRLGGLIIWEANYGINEDKKTSDVWYAADLHQYTSNHYINGKRFDDNIVLKAYWLEGNDIVEEPSQPDVVKDKAIIVKGARSSSKSAKYHGLTINSAYTGVPLDYQLNQVSGENWVYFPSIQTYVDPKYVRYTNENVSGKTNRGKIKGGATAKSKDSRYNNLPISSHVIDVAMECKPNAVKGTDWVYFPSIQTYVSEKDVKFV